MALERLSNCELDVMKILWEHEQGISQAMLKEELEQQKEREYGRTTIATWLTRLKRKEFVGSFTMGGTTCYSPLVKREEYERMEVNLLANRLFKGSFPKIVATLVDAEQLTKEDAKEIQEIIDGWNH